MEVEDILEEVVTDENIIQQVDAKVKSLPGIKEATEAGAAWKQYLSGALSDAQIYLAMIVLFIFYFIYTLYNAWLDSNAEDQDEGEVIRNCTCDDGHRAFYLGWSIGCFTLWFILHSLYTLSEAFPAVTKSLKLKITIQVSIFLENFRICKDDENDSGEEDSSERKLKKTTDLRISQCEKLLWSQSYEMYAIGIKKKDVPLDRKDMEKLITKSLSPEVLKKEILNAEESQDNTDNGGEAEQQLQQKYKKFHIAKRVSLALFHAMLKIVRYIAQLSVVPLLIVQMFDTYTLLCLAERDYCDSESQYRLHLDQTALSFAFYCALMLSLLVTVWLNLVPWPHLKLDNFRSYKVLHDDKVTDI